MAHDFAHGTDADRNRAAKSRRLALWMELVHPRPLDHVVDYANPRDPDVLKRRRAVEKDAGVRQSSDETWAAALGLLRARPLRRARDPRAPGCSCIAVHGEADDILWAFAPHATAAAVRRHDGWPCPHDPGNVDTWPAEARPLPGLDAVTAPTSDTGGGAADLPADVAAAHSAIATAVDPWDTLAGVTGKWTYDTAERVDPSDVERIEPSDLERGRAGLADGSIRACRTDGPISDHDAALLGEFARALGVDPAGPGDPIALDDIPTGPARSLDPIHLSRPHVPGVDPPVPDTPVDRSTDNGGDDPAGVEWFDL